MVHYDDFGELSSLSPQQYKIESHASYVQFLVEQSISERTTSSYGVWAASNNEDALDSPGDYKTIDLDATYVTQLSDNHRLNYGMGYRLIEVSYSQHIDDIDFFNLPFYVRAATTDREVDSLINLFGQSDYYWTEQFHTVFGIKAEYFEHKNTFELQPQLRGLYSLDTHHSIWAGIGRAVTSPSYADSSTIYIQNYLTSPNSAMAVASRSVEDLDVESAITTEIGYRYQGSNFDVDTTVFMTKHDNVKGLGPNWFDSRYPHVVGVNYIDTYKVDTYGLELATQYVLSSNYQVFANYTYLSAEHSWDGVSNTSIDESNWYSIDHQHLATIQSLWQINAQWQLDVIAKGQITEYGGLYGKIPNFVTFDTRLAWQKHPHAPMFEAVVQNLFDEDYSADWRQTRTGQSNDQIAYLRVSHDF